MEEGKRQKQIAGLLNQEMNDIFQRLGLEARFYLSFFQVSNPQAALHKIEERHHDIKKELANRVRHQLRSIPVLKFFRDDTLDHVFKMEELFERIEADRKKQSKKTDS
jgi:ribosome-binding factor A